MVKILVVGSGAREHAMLWKLAQSPHVDRLYAAPGNGGTQQIAENISIGATDIEGIIEFARKEGINLTVASQDRSLALGIVDAFKAEDLRIFGPTQAAAKIEWSKVYAKELMARLGISTAPYRIFTDPDKALEFIDTHKPPFVVKADELADGKGSYVCHTIENAGIAVDKIMIQRVHEGAGKTILIEEFIPGDEASGQYFSDGKDIDVIPISRDYKDALDDDKGLKTGGMGAVTSFGFPEELEQQATGKTIGPMIRYLAKEGTPFRGCLFPGFKITPEGLKVIEFNSRFGDPEWPACVRRMKTDLFVVMNACIDGELAQCKVEWEDGASISIVAASGGYPGKYETGYLISGIKEAEKIPGVKVFHGGTVMSGGVLRTSAGRVLQVTAKAETLREAFKVAYHGVWCINFKKMHFRHDIGVKAILESSNI